MAPIVPPRVRHGDRIAVVAPAGPVKPERVQRALARTGGFGRVGDLYRFEISPSVLGPRAPETPSFLAASDAVRADELNAALRDPDIRAIAMVRGGYGVMRILPLLDAAALRADPKPIIGFSDGTALLAWAYAAGVRGIHGPVFAQLGELGDEDVARFLAVLAEPGSVAVPVATTHGTARGHLVPANLTLASMLVGTPWPLPLAHAIALFEEVGERPYELDRSMMQLRLTGALADVRAVVLGDLTRCDDAAPPTGTPDPVDFAIATLLSHVPQLPTAIGAPVGHGTRNFAVPFGGDAELSDSLLTVGPAVY